MQFEVETAGVTYGLSVGIAPPQCCCAGVTVGTEGTSTLTHNLKHREGNTVNVSIESDMVLDLRKVANHLESYQSLLGSDQGSVLAIHLVVQSAGVTQVVACTVAAPQRRCSGSAVYALSGLCLQKKVEVFY